METSEKPRPAFDRKLRIRELALSCGFLLAAFLYPLLSPLHGIPLCPFRALTGHSCPGCGITRSCVAFMHLDLWGSLQLHPLGWLASTYLVGSGVRALIELRRGRAVARGRLLSARWERIAWGSLIVFLLLFGGVRLALELSGVAPAA